MSGCLSNKERQNPVMFLSFSHANNLAAANENKKTIVIQTYNENTEQKRYLMKP